MNRLYIQEILFNRKIPKDSYLHTLSAVQHLIKRRKLSFHKNVTFFVGENGTGKSTLIEAIALCAGFNPEGGTKNFNFSTRNTHSDLWEFLTVSRSRYPNDGFFLRAESFYNVATNIDELDEIPGGGAPIISSYGGISLHKQSHGESFLSLVQNRFGGKGLYILDEPEAALSPMRQMTLLCEIHRLEKADSQFIIATHSPILMTYPGAEVYLFSDGKIESVPYAETEHYQIARRFLSCPEQMLSYLFEEE